jgi:apolipoprotein N-acyltransferase
MMPFFKSKIMFLPLAILSGILMFLGWPTFGIFPLLFVGIVPLFFALEKLEEGFGKWKFPLLLVTIFIAHFVWIGVSLRWVHVTSPKTYYIAITLESLSIALALLPYFLIKKQLGDKMKWVFFLVAWMAVEYFNQHWMMGAPYFALGSGFGMYPQLIQLYEFIGIEGGTLFLLLSNVFFFTLIKAIFQKKVEKANIIALSIALSPFVLSLFFSMSEEKESSKDRIHIAALHTYQETYTTETHNHPEKVVDGLYNLSSKSDLNQFELICWPETVISNMGWLNGLINENAYKSLYAKLDQHKDLSICTGGYGFSLAKDGPNDPYSRLDEARGFYFQAHNVAVTINKTGRWPIRSKEIFIPFQERIPFLKEMPFLRNFADVVGANETVSYYEYGDNLHKTLKGNIFVPVLCFESIYPVRMAENAKDANFVTILANEFWNKDLSGSDQYMFNHIAIAIQSRTPIIRSSNSGISVIIDRRGNVIERRKGSDVGVISAVLNKKTDQTFYEKIAGVFYGLSTFLFFVLIVLGLFLRFFKSTKKA